MSKTSDTAAPFRFLHLPAEIRNIIYRQVLVVEEPLHLCNPVHPFDTEANEGIELHLDLLLVCRQVHNEAVKILCGENVFITTPLLRIQKYAPDWINGCPMCEIRGGCYGYNPSDLMDQIGSKNREDIRAVEMVITPKVCWEHVNSMSRWLPKLDRLTLVFSDKCGTMRTFQYDQLLLQEFVRYCQALASAIPTVEKIRFDFSVLIEARVKNADDCSSNENYYFDVEPLIRGAFNSVHSLEVPFVESQISRLLIADMHDRIAKTLMAYIRTGIDDVHDDEDDEDDIGLAFRM